MRYSRVAEAFEDLEATQKNLEKTDILAELFRDADDELANLVLLSTGTPFPAWKNMDLGVSSKTLVKIISKATGRSEDEITETWKNEGDLGLAAEAMVEKKTQQRLMTQEITVEKVVDRLQKVADTQASGLSQSVDQDKKQRELADLISSAEPKEARYLARIIINNLRLGIGEGTIRDALAEAFFDGEHSEEIQKAYDFTNDFAEVAEACREGIEKVRSLELELERPIKSMLAKKVETIEEGFEEVGKPAAIDYKYDGMRAQIHVKDGGVTVFTRRLEDVTEQFPDVVEAVEENIESENCIIDTEIVGYDPEDGSMIPFQKLSKRIKRKYEIQKLKAQIPVTVRPFDLIYLDEPILERPYSERWRELQEIVSEEEKVMKLVDHAETSEEEKVGEMQQASLSAGHEGIMMKSLEAEYKPGNRVGYMVKLKPVMETLDLAIIGAKWSEGRRSDWLGRLYLGCYDEENDEYLEVGKMATGLTDEQFQEITEKLKPLITKEDGRKVEVRPEVIVEAEYEEIQESPNYSSGYALRFPRMKQFREDKEQADSLQKVKNLYEDQS
ncbi:ATP-dependent DNA ligase [Candidatus Nanosalina sp. VS9-1]|uniref:ATP-dependent DNA ligase n=1 Tax=Candidatus Nanosalina sp. VS9-1 TaxID=3388566 RepID=UPI0039E13110